jgi:hypothetical protein
MRLTVFLFIPDDFGHVQLFTTPIARIAACE